MLEAPVDGLGRAVGCAGTVEVGQDVGGALGQGPAKCEDLAQRGRDATADGVDQPLHQLLASGPVGFSVGGDHPLVDPPGRLDLDVGVDLEQLLQPVLLLVGEQVRAGVQGPPRAVERVVLVAAVTAGVLLDSAAALVECVAGQAHHVEGVHHRDRLGQFLGGGGLEAGEPVHRDDLDRLTPGVGAFGQPRLEGLLGAALDHVQEAGRPGAFADRGEVDDHGDVFVAAAGVAPDVLVDADHGHPVEPAGVIDEDPLALGQHGVVGGVPRHRETFSDAGHAQVLAHDPFQRPPQSAARELRPRLGRLRGALAPHVPAPGAPVAADRDQQCRRSPAQRLVRQPPHHGVSRRSLAAAALAPLVRLNDPARQDRSVRLEALPDGLEAELVQAGERGQVRAGEGSVRHVEVFRMGSVRTPIIGRPRPLPGQRRAATRYTLDSEEPLFQPIVDAGWRIKFAHRTFQWDSEAPGKAAVHCVIIGFTRDRAKKRRLWDYLTARSEPLEATGVRSINAYLVDGPEILVGKRTTPLAPDLPMVDYGSKPADGGNLIITPEDYDTVMADPVMAPYVRPYVGSKELLSDRKRWCLWLPEMDSSAPARSPELKRRLEGVAAMREASSAASTRDWARFPRLFRQTGLVSDVPFVGIPEVSSENRYYLPVSHLEPEVIISNKVYGAVDPNGIVFAVASSSMFWTWMKTVGGRMKSDPSFSSTITWNNFPMPALTSEQRAALASAGAKILDARDQHPGRSLEDHYTPLSMTPELVRAHDQLDTVMDKIIGAPRRCRTILERQELLFASYVRMTSNVSAAPRAGLVPQPILAG